MYKAYFECHDILMLGKSPIKCRQRPSMTIAVKRQFKQTKYNTKCKKINKKLDFLVNEILLILKFLYDI